MAPVPDIQIFVFNCQPSDGCTRIITGSVGYVPGPILGAGLPGLRTVSFVGVPERAAWREYPHGYEGVITLAGVEHCFMYVVQDDVVDTVIGPPDYIEQVLNERRHNAHEARSPPTYELDRTSIEERARAGALARYCARVAKAASISRGVFAVRTTSPMPRHGLPPLAHLGRLGLK